jgi:hypothetical protein
MAENDNNKKPFGGKKAAPFAPGGKRSPDSPKKADGTTKRKGK